LRFSPFYLEEDFNNTEGSYSLSLGSTTCPSLSLAGLLAYFPKQEKHLNDLLDLKQDYSEQYGSRLLRQRLAERCPGSRADYFLVTSGASEAIFLVFSTLFAAGDRIIVQKPIYQSLYQIAEDNGVNIIDWDYELGENFSDYLSRLEHLLKANPKVKALVINNPNNPLGIGFNSSEMQALTELIAKRQILLIADEVFKDVSLKATASAYDFYEQSIVISDLSKSFSMPGLRLGWILSRDMKILAELSSQKNYLSLRSSTLSEFIGVLVLQKAEEILLKNKNLAAKNLAYLYEQNPESLPFKLYLAQEAVSGLCLFPKLRREESADAFCDYLLQEHSFFIPKGSCFGHKYSRHIRIGFGMETDKFYKALELVLKVREQGLRSPRQADAQA
jgi:aspartate/methionine/tyrosine aminotransferase